MVQKFFSHIPIRTKLGVFALVGGVGVVLMSTFTVVDKYQQSVQERKELVQHQVEAAASVLAWAHRLETSGSMPRKDAQHLAMGAIRNMRYNQKEYFWINDLQGTMLMHPIKPELEGKGGDSIRDPNGFLVIAEAAKKARQEGAGFLSYLWPKPGKDVAVEKTSYVQGFTPWGWVLGSGMYLDDLHDKFVSSAVRLAAAVLALALVVGALAWAIARSLVQGIGVAVDVAHAVAAGNLAVPIEQAQGRDEVSDLINTMHTMQSGLSSVVSLVRNGSNSINTASAEIASANYHLSARTEAQASALQQTAASMEQLSATVQRNADSASEANQLALTASAIAEQGGQVVGEVVQTMKEISNSSQKIAEIIGVIDGIAFQTNILALNAAIEAARAGDRGRGFAVVASEVRSLAARSADAAREIKQLIGASVERVQHGSDLVDRAGNTMHQVVDSIRHVTNIMGQISNSSAEQALGVTEVRQAVAQIDQVTQQNTALVEEMAAAADSLKDLAQELVQHVAQFALKESNQTGAGSSVGLQALQQAQVTGINLDNAIKAHTQWRTKLRLAAQTGEHLDAATVSRDDCCELGKWLHGPGGGKYGKKPSFVDLIVAHKQFHQEAGAVARHINQGQQDTARQQLENGTPFSEISNKVIELIVRLRREIEGVARQPLHLPEAA